MVPRQALFNVLISCISRLRDKKCLMYSEAGTLHVNEASSDNQHIQNKRVLRLTEPAPISKQTSDLSHHERHAPPPPRSTACSSCTHLLICSAISSLNVSTHRQKTSWYWHWKLTPELSTAWSVVTPSTRRKANRYSSIRSISCRQRATVGRYWLSCRQRQQGECYGRYWLSWRQRRQGECYSGQNVTQATVARTLLR